MIKMNRFEIDELYTNTAVNDIEYYERLQQPAKQVAVKYMTLYRELEEENSE